MDYSVQTSTPMADPNIALENVFKKYPRFTKTIDPANTEVLFAPKERVRGENQLEYWPSTEEGTPDFPHPKPGKTVLEVYSDKLKQDPKLLEQAIYGDLLHGMRNDETFSVLRDEFKKGVSPQTLEFEKKNGNFEGLNDDSRLDAYIRGYLAPDEADEWGKNQRSGVPVWSDKQLKILDIMKKYIGSKD